MTHWVLILEDERDCAAMVEKEVAAAGASGIIVASIPQFAEAYITFEPDLLVLDVLLGNQDCGAAIDFLAGRGCRVPLVFLSGLDFRLCQFMATLARDKGLQVAAAIDKRDAFPRLRAELARLLGR